jgi:hypothetical protein
MVPPQCDPRGRRGGGPPASSQPGLSAEILSFQFFHVGRFLGSKSREAPISKWRRNFADYIAMPPPGATLCRCWHNVGYTFISPPDSIEFRRRKRYLPKGNFRVGDNPGTTPLPVSTAFIGAGREPRSCIAIVAQQTCRRIDVAPTSMARRSGHQPSVTQRRTGFHWKSTMAI